jgi:hypothetical protein
VPRRRLYGPAVPLTAEKVDTAPDRAAPPPPPRWRRAGALVGGLAAAWLVPLATNAVHLDVLLLPLVLVGTASLLRSGRTALDRLVLAGVLLYAGLCVVGLLFSVWPWHLEPVPIAGLALSTLVLVSWGARRWPRLPLRFRPADVMVVVLGLGSMAFLAWPLAHRDAINRLATFMHVEDFSRHLMIYDSIRRVGGYLFLHWNAALPRTGATGYLPYPQGSHFVTAVLENFLESSATPATNPMAWTSHFVLWHVAGYMALCLVVLWAARWVAGPGASAARVLPVLALATAMLLFGNAATVYTGSYPQEVYALIALAAFVAVVVRPVHRRREQLVLAGGLFAAVGMTYYLFLPAAIVAAVAWLVVYRRRLWRNKVLALVCVLGGGFLSVLFPLVMYTQVQLDVGGTLELGGQLVGYDPYQGIAIGLVAAAGGAALALRRSRVGVQVLVAVVAGLGLAEVINRYQLAHHVGNQYFYYKSLHATMVIVLVALGAAAYLVPRVPAAARGSRRVLRFAPAVVLALAGFAALGAVPGELVAGAQNYLTGPTWERPASAYYPYALWQRYPRADGRTTVVWLGTPWNSFLATTYLGIYQGNYGPAALIAIPMRPWEPGGAQLPAVEKDIRDGDGRYRVVADDPKVLSGLRAFAKTLPAGKLQVVDVTGQL